MEDNSLLFEIARGIRATGADLTHARFRGVGGGGDFSAMKRFVRMALAPDDANDPPPSERLVNCVTHLMQDSMCAMHETDVRGLQVRGEE